MFNVRAVQVGLPTVTRSAAAVLRERLAITLALLVLME